MKLQHWYHRPIQVDQPVAGLEERESPEKNVDVEEEEEVGEQNGVVVAPSPERRERGC